MTASPGRIFAEFFFDFTVAIGLLLLGLFLADAAHNRFTPDWDILYLAWMEISFLPLAFFVRWRQAMNFDGWDLLACGSWLFCVMAFFFTLPPLPLLIDAWGKALLMTPLFYWDDFRESTFPRAKTGA